MSHFATGIVPGNNPVAIPISGMSTSIVISGGNTGPTGPMGANGPAGSKGDPGLQGSRGIGGDSHAFTFYGGIHDAGEDSALPTKQGALSFWRPTGNPSPEGVQRIFIDDKNSTLGDVSGWLQAITQPGRLKVAKEEDPNTYALFNMRKSTYEGFGTPWPQLRHACISGGDVTFKYSFIKSGTSAADHSAGGSANCVELKDHVDNSVSFAQFTGEIGSALNEWKGLFESIFTGLNLTFQNMGQETGNSVPSDNSIGTYAIPHPLESNIGDLRFGMHNIDGPSNVIAHGYEPGGVLGSYGNVGGDIHFDSSEDWRLDSTSHTSNLAFSIKYIAVHEIGHALGLGHDTDPSSALYSTVSLSNYFSSKFASGLKYSLTEREAVENIYGPNAADWDYAKKTVSWLAGSGSFVNNDSVVLSYISAGTTGPTGGLGPSGGKGATGPTGNISGGGLVAGNLNVGGHVFPPNTGDGYALGQSGKHWSGLWIGGNSIYSWVEEQGGYVKEGWMTNIPPSGYIEERVVKTITQPGEKAPLICKETTWISGEQYSNGDRVCARVMYPTLGADVSGIECFECEPDTASNNSTMGVCCITGGCVNMTMEQCCASGGTLFYPNTTCDGVDFDICVTGAGGANPCSGYGGGGGATANCSGVPGEDSAVGWVKCKSPELVKTTDEPPCITARKFIFQGETQTDSRPINGISFWRNPYNSGKRYDSVERILIDDYTASGEKLFRAGFPFQMAAGLYTWPEEESSDEAFQRTSKTSYHRQRISEGRFRVYKERDHKQFLEYKVRPHSVNNISSEYLYEAMWSDDDPHVDYTPGPRINVGIPSLEKAMRDGGNVNITYSFVPEGLSYYSRPNTIPISGKTLAWGQSSGVGPNYYSVGQGNWSDKIYNRELSAQQMQDECSAAFDEWADLFNDVYSSVGLNLTFTNLGLENTGNFTGEYANAIYPQGTIQKKGKYTSSQQYAINPVSGYPGDIRFNMYRGNILDNSAAFVMDPLIDTDPLGVSGSFHGNVSINANVNWRLDSHVQDREIAIHDRNLHFPAWLQYEKFAKTGNFSGVYSHASIPYDYDGENIARQYVFKYPAIGCNLSLKFVMMHELGHVFDFHHEGNEQIGGTHKQPDMMRGYDNTKRPFCMPRPSGEQDKEILTARGIESLLTSTWDGMSGFSENEAGGGAWGILVPAAQTHWEHKMHLMAGGCLDNTSQLWPDGKMKHDSTSREYAEVYGRINKKAYNKIGYRKLTFLKNTENYLTTPFVKGEKVWVCWIPETAYKSLDEELEKHLKATSEIGRGEEAQIDRVHQEFDPEREYGPGEKNMTNIPPSGYIEGRGEAD